MSPSIFVKILCYTRRPFKINLASSTFLSVLVVSDPEVVVRIRQRPAQINSEDARVVVKGLYMQQRILTRNDRDISLRR
jgi:hypothetical protein